MHRSNERLGGFSRPEVVCHALDNHKGAVMAQAASISLSKFTETVQAAVNVLGASTATAFEGTIYGHGRHLIIGIPVVPEVLIEK